jgi:hypothetical protein
VEGPLTRAGIPIGRRGAIAFDTASFTGGDNKVSALALALGVTMPFTGHTFLDVRVPFGVAIHETTNAALGNVMLGSHHVAQAGERMWLALGGAVGLTTLSGRSQDHAGYEPLGAARAYWDLHEYFPSILPIEGRMGIEKHVGLIILRGEIDPVLYIPIGRNSEFELAVQHAAEIQVGHWLGGGLRVQGIALPTFDNVDVRHAVARNLYVFSIEPFLTLERKYAFLRTGLVLPFDEELGPPLSHTWGFQLTAGLRVE